jgi:hypothetical protein
MRPPGRRLMQRTWIGAALALGACKGQGDGRATDSGVARTASVAAASAGQTISAGTALAATIQRIVTSRTDTAGAPVKAIVSLHVFDAQGAMVIPGGSEFVLTIADVRAARDAAGTGGALALTATSVMVGGATYRVSGSVSAVAHALTLRPASSHYDLVVTPGTPITITLTQPLTITATQAASAPDRTSSRSQETP